MAKGRRSKKRPTPRHVESIPAPVPESAPRAPTVAPAYMDLKAKAVLAALHHDENLYLNTRNRRHVWHAWQLARRAKTAIPAWVLSVIDGIAAQEVTKRSRKTDAAERYEAALTQMEVAVSSHRRRVHIRKVAKQLGTHVDVSRRDTPNLSAIARTAAQAHGVSVNRLLARYRSSR